MPAPMGSDRITGETRYRSGWFGKLILQVEEVYDQGYHARPQPGIPTSFTATRWRDARPADLYLIGWHERAARAKAEGAPPPPPPDHFARLNAR